VVQTLVFMVSFHAVLGAYQPISHTMPLLVFICTLRTICRYTACAVEKSLLIAQTSIRFLIIHHTERLRAGSVTAEVDASVSFAADDMFQSFGCPCRT
jgi:hypothetical protein